jgi:hypothetical protein
MPFFFLQYPPLSGFFVAGLEGGGRRDEKSQRRHVSAILEPNSPLKKAS